MAVTLCFLWAPPPKAQDNRVGDAFMTCSAPLQTDFVLARFSVQDVVNQPYGVWWNAPPVSHGPTNNWIVGNLGQVYGIATDPFLNVYVSATAVFGPFNYNSVTATTIYRIDPAGNITALATGIPSVASSVWDGQSMTVQHPSLGNLCYDNFHHQLLVTSFENGFIYRIDPATGAILGSFDPMGADTGPAGGNGWAPMGERVWGIACHGTDSSDVVVYYSTWGEDHRTGGTIPMNGPNTIRRVSLDDQGDFLTGTDGQIYVQPGQGGGTVSSPVADIAVSPDGGTIWCAERTMIGDFKWTYQTWSSWAHRARLIELPSGATNNFQIGNYSIGENGAGGVDWGLWDTDPDDNDPGGRCDSILWCTSAPIALGGGNSLYGMQSFPQTGGGNADGVWVDADGVNAGQDKGTLGDVELIKNCCDFVDVVTECDSCSDDSCCFEFTFINNFATQFYGAIEMTLLDFGQPGFQSTMSVNILDQDWTIFGFTQTHATIGMANGSMIPSGTSEDVVKVCFDGALDGTYALEVQWLDYDRDTLCTDTMYLRCDSVFNCLELIQDSIFCKGTDVGYAIWVQNHSNFTFQSLDIIPSNPNFTVSPDPIVLDGSTYPPLPPGQVGGPYFVEITGPAVIPGDEFCYILSAHDTPDPQTAPNCCTDSVEYCVEIPNCNPCDSVWAYVEGDTNTCIFEVHFVNNFDDMTFTEVQTELLGGATFANAWNQPGWQFAVQGGFSEIHWETDPSGFIPLGDNYAGDIQVTGGSPYAMEVRWMIDDSVVCIDTVYFDCHEVTCLEVVKDSIYCEGADVGYAIWVENHSNFTFQSLDIIPSNPNITVTPDPIVLNGMPYPPLPPGQVGGPYFVTLTGTGVVPGDQFCYIVSAHDTPDPQTAPNCCTDSVEYCVEIPACDPCDSVYAYVEGDKYSCEFELHFVNNHNGNTFTEVQTELLGGATFSSVLPQPGWSMSVQPGFAEVHWETNPSGFIPYGDNYAGDIMVTGGSPYAMEVRWMIDDSIVCTDTVYFECDENCVALVEDTVYCVEGQAFYDFTILNNSSSPPFTFQRIFIDVLNGFPGVFTPNEWNAVSIPPGTQWSPPSPVQLSGANPGDQICFIIVAHDHPYPQGTHLNCCPSDTICITMPDCRGGCLPTIDVIGDTTICEGESTILCGLPCGECRESMWMEWTGPNGYYSNTNCPVITVPGTYCLTVWCDGVAQGPVCQTITAQPTAWNGIIGNPGSPDCVGDPVTLTADVCCDNPSFLWSNGATTQSINVTTQYGNNTYSVTVWCPKASYWDQTSWVGQWCEVKKDGESAGAPTSGQPHIDAFPNPFTDMATFRFSLPKADYGKLQAYSTDGRMVAVLFEGDIKADYIYEGQFSSDQLADGVYYLRMQTEGGQVLTKRVVLRR